MWLLLVFGQDTHVHRPVPLYRSSRRWKYLYGPRGRSTEFLLDKLAIRRILSYIVYVCTDGGVGYWKAVVYAPKPLTSPGNWCQGRRKRHDFIASQHGPVAFGWEYESCRLKPEIVYGLLHVSGVTAGAST
jgi:hypothetical protein